MKYWILLCSLFAISSCVQPIEQSFEKLPPGIWRGVLVIDKAPEISEKDAVTTKMEQRTGELPFTFEVKYTNDTTFNILLKNADEIITVDDIVYNRDKATAKDTLKIDFPVFNTYITAIFEDNIMEGYWHVPSKGNYTIPFKAYHGQGHRFTTLKEAPITDITGKWETKFGTETDNPYPAIGEFKQDGNHLTGTFMTETGDYRYLEGTIQGNKIYLSTFDGSHAFMFQGKVLEDASITGLFESGKHYQTSWEAVKNENAKLTDAFVMTKLTNPSEPLQFTVKDLNGKDISLDDVTFENKVKLVKISGTWCPNCKDEIIFLKEYFKTNTTDDVEVLELNFEKGNDVQKSLDVLKRYKQKMNVPFNVLYAGQVKKGAVHNLIPNIEKIKSYPTLLFVDRDNTVRKIHTGFAGPATSEYANFKKEFHAILTEMINK